MENEKINLSDKELYYISLTIEEYVKKNELSKKDSYTIKRIVKKLISNGGKRKDAMSIIHPILYLFNK